MTDPAPTPLATEEERAAHAALAEAWYAAWNAHDLDAILSHYAEAIEFTSPVVRRRTGRTDGTIRDKATLGAYFRAGLEANPALRFRPLGLLHGVGCLTLLYRGAEGRLVAETLWPDAGGRIARAAVTYGEATERHRG